MLKILSIQLVNRGVVDNRDADFDVLEFGIDGDLLAGFDLPFVAADKEFGTYP